ncbi:hypothetical protein HYZ80_01690 [Candidatus Parcubacteria bacterium]|nr:hypothetical protein [Candidatus Parcubacteria bacterium]
MGSFHYHIRDLEPTGFQSRLPAYGQEGSRQEAERLRPQGGNMKNLIEVDPEKANLHQFLAAHLLNASEEITPAQHSRVLTRALLAAAKAHNDGVAEELVMLLGRSYELTELGLCHDEPRGQARAAFAKADKQFRQHLRELYWQLPDARLVKDGHWPDTKGSGTTRHGTLLETKLAMLGSIIQDWTSRPTEESVVAFRFMIAAYRPGPAGNDLRKGESFAEWKAHGRFVSETEQDRILRLIRDHVGVPPITTDTTIELWLEQPLMPDEIQRVLVMARARRGGPELAKRDIRNAEALAALDRLEQTNKRSCRPETLQWIKEQADSIALLDVWLTSLLKAMQPEDGNLASNVERIGESDYVLGEIRLEFRVSKAKQIATVEFGSSRWVELTVELPADCAEELGRDIFGRARHHIEKWRETHYDVSVELFVNGGAANLKLHNSFLLESRA